MICGILPFSFIADFGGGGGGVGETLRLLKAINPKLNTLFGKEDKIHAFLIKSHLLVIAITFVYLQYMQYPIYN